jgi:twinkle protein
MDYRERLKELGITLTSSGYQTCPQCSDTRKKSNQKCLTVTYSEDAVLYCCHHCDWSGVVPYKEVHKKVFAKPIKPNGDYTFNVIEWLGSRGISAGIGYKYCIGETDKGEIILPYYKNKELVNIKYRITNPDGSKGFFCDKGTEQTFFGMDFVDTTQPLIIVEGEIDVLSLAQQGIYAVSVPFGGNDIKLECIENCYDFIRKFNKYIIAVDNDNTGYKLKNNLVDRLGKEKCDVVNWGQYKDANEALMAGENLKDYIDKAQPICPDGVSTYCDNYDAIYDSIFGEDTDYYYTGWSELDNIIKIRLGYLMVVTGYPSRGKSTFVNNLLVNLTRRYGFKHLIASFETTEASSYIEFLEMLKQQPIDKLKEHKETVFEDFEYISDHFLRLDTSRQWTVDEIAKKTEYMVRRYGIKTLIIDPYNRLKNDFKDREDKYIGGILSKLCMLSKKLNILIIFVAHPKKPDDEELPTMYSISGSGDWYNMADYGIIVHRERNQVTQELENEPNIYVGKVKNFSLGKPSGGVVKLSYNKDKRILEDARR